MRKKQQGFSLIELVIVIVILGILAATAIPRFLNVTDEAEEASVDGVSSGLATAVSFVRSQWEVDGRKNSDVVLDGTNVNVDTRFGYPTGTSGATSATAMTHESCKEVFDTVLQSVPNNVLSTADARNERFTVRMLNGAGGSTKATDGTDVTGLDLCVYHQVSSLTLNQSGVPTPNPDLNTASAKGITYNPGTGQVLSFTN
ncbi:type II secretion system protein [Shewanella sp. AS1]|uniref:pilin n=1 Tax=Shewanella sp. AS1 TaxID=2907626 RepID=UPI001F270911|nr:prepilin-type N-terminal cleavage/methylation domain-containing protein [Shewanella sp. AS1]MCE9679787.1 type II secretion system protein [Shewanella sp. AS1]